MKIRKSQLRRLIKEAFSGYADERPNNPMERAYAKRDRKDLWVSYDQLSPEVGGRTERKVEGPFTSQAIVNAVIKRIKEEQGGMARNIQVANEPPPKKRHPLDADGDGKLTISEIKITRKQLRQIIREEKQRLDEIPTYRKMAAARAGVPHMGSSPPPPGHPSRPSPQTDEDPHGDEAEHDRGFIDGYYGELAAEDATSDYHIGYEQGDKEYASDEERGTNRDPEDILRTQYA